MRTSLLQNLLPAGLALAGAALILHWLGTDWGDGRFEARVPGPDPALLAMASQPPVDLRGTFTRSDGAAPDLPGAWPRFRGANLDNICTDPVPLSVKWGSEGPPSLWTLAMGEGYAGAAVSKGRAYVLDYDEHARQDVVRCLSLADGKELWRRAYAVDVGRNHGISRTVPAVSDGFVVTLGPKCHVLCVDPITGDFKWGIDLVREYKTAVPAWYAGQCPLIDAGRAILAPGGEALMIAVDCATGNVIWKTPNPRKWEMTHSSVVPVTIDRQKMYVYCASGGVVGVSADDGRILWELADWKVSMANVPSPLPIGDGRLLLTGGYGAGAMMIRVSRAGDKFIAAPLFRLKPDAFGAEQHTPILYQGHIYGVIPGGQLVCIDTDGKRVWASGGKHRFGLGPFIIADGKIILMNDGGQLTIAEATPQGYRQLAQADVLEDAHESWGPFALVGGRLIARDMTRMVCLDLRGSP